MYCYAHTYFLHNYLIHLQKQLIMTVITEGKAVVAVETGKISKKLPVFYNPQMKFNRDVSVLLLKTLNRKNMVIADPLAASGIRAIRFCKELPKSMIKEIRCNDISTTAVQYMKRNISRNKCGKKITVCQSNANLFLLKNKPFDYIDIDPFGPPTPFLDAASQSLRKNSILAVTATDTAALAGTAPKACKRKYWAVPLHNHLMHEIGLRILIRRCQLVAASWTTALTPIYSYSKQHYMRVFFIASNKMIDIDKILRQHKELFYNKKTMLLDDKGDIKCGPLWTGPLWDKKLAKDLAKLSHDPFLQLLADEAQINSIGFLDTHVIARNKKKEVQSLQKFTEQLQKKGYKVSRTHFADNGLRLLRQ